MIIALTGAGGKTTLGRQMAVELSRMGCRTLFTTTTKIYPPEDGSVYIGPAISVPEDGLFITAAKAALPNGKLQGYTPHEIETLTPLFDHIIVEADGAAGKAVKAPNDAEPVYPLLTDIVIGVIGLDCLGKPITDEFVHRAPLFADITESQCGDIITAQHIIRLIRHPYGLFRGAPPKAEEIVFLNKYDTLVSINKDGVTVVTQNSSVPVLLTSRETNWFPDFCTAYVKNDKKMNDKLVDSFAGSEFEN